MKKEYTTFMKDNSCRKPKWRFIFPLLFLLSLPHIAHSQIAGLTTLSVLNMPTSTRSAALGMDYISVYEPDLLTAIANPSLVDESLHNSLSLSYTNLFAGANFGSLAYGHNFKKLGIFTFALLYDNFGQFEGYDEQDNTQGNFSATDYIFNLGWGRQVAENFTIGANFKPILSQYESYKAFAFSIDLAGSYYSPDKQLALTLLARNIGAQVILFDQTREHLPFELSLTGSYKLADAPFRLFFSLNELQTWNLSYEDPLNPTFTTDPFSGEVTSKSDFSKFVDNLGRHINVGVELNIKKSFFARLGYSYRKAVEMKGADALNMSGFSFGFGIKTKRFEFAYARNNYHLGQAPNTISITTNLQKFSR